MKPDYEELAKLPTDPRTGKRFWKGWEVVWDYGQWWGTSPDYDASWEGEEDGWVGNGQRVSSRTLAGCLEEIDCWLEENQ